VWLNGLVLVIGVVLLIAHATRPPPRTAGIIEMTPTERAGHEAEILNGPRPPAATRARH
jgi:hypothetical protein